MNSIAMPCRSCRSSSRLTTWAWIETSSAEIGSSQTSRSGPVASARAITARWRWPPESSCGICRAEFGRRARPHRISASTRACALGPHHRPVHAERLGDLLRRWRGGGRARRAGPGRRAACARAGGARPDPPSSGMGAPSKRTSPASGGFHAERQPPRGRFAATGFADQAERPAAFEAERDAGHRAHRRRPRGTAAAAGIAALHVFELEQAHAGTRSGSGSGADAGDAAAPARAERSGGTPATQAAIASGQRGAKAQPGGRRRGSGTPPGIAAQAFARARRPAAARPAARAYRDGAARRTGVRRRRGLHDAPGIHHRDAVAHLADHAEIMADQHERHAEFAAHTVEQLEDLRLDRHVERRGGLVRDQQLGLPGERHGDHHALVLAAGELVRIGVEPPRAHRGCRPARRAAPLPRAPRRRRGRDAGAAPPSPARRRAAPG